MSIRKSEAVNNAQNEVLKALNIALQMETDGKEFYLNASRKSNNTLGKELFEYLAAEEEKHKQNFQKIFEEMKEKQSWPELKIVSGAHNIKTLFEKALQNKKPAKVSSTSQESADIEVALNMENQSIKFYQEQVEKTVHPSGKEFYRALAAEERGHYLNLIEYREYLNNPESWYTLKEHPSLDGG